MVRRLYGGRGSPRGYRPRPEGDGPAARPRVRTDFPRVSRVGEDPAGAHATLREAVALTRTGPSHVITAVGLYWEGLAAQAVGESGAARDAVGRGGHDRARSGAQARASPTPSPAAGGSQSGRGLRDGCRAVSPRRCASTARRRTAGVRFWRWRGWATSPTERARTSARRCSWPPPPRSAMRSASPRRSTSASSHERLLKDLEEPLGPARFAACQAMPQTWTYEDLVAYALEGREGGHVGPPPRLPLRWRAPARDHGRGGRRVRWRRRGGPADLGPRSARGGPARRAPRTPTRGPTPSRRSCWSSSPSTPPAAAASRSAAPSGPARRPRR
jgi:hypothetical protein